MGDTPVPIPNTMVKTRAADGTILETVWESRWLPDSHGGIAQLGEHLPCKQGVTSSNLVISIRQFKIGRSSRTEGILKLSTYLENYTLKKKRHPE